MTRLKRAYLDYNDRYWAGKLPDDLMVKWAYGIDAMGDSDPEIIRINALLRRWECAWRATLLHECAHIAVDLTGPELKDHGPKFKREIRRLLRAGAFDGLL